jgi:hypothetical protein
MKIVKLKLCGPLLPGQCAHAIMYDEDLQFTKDGDLLPWQDCCSGLTGNAKVTVKSNSHRPVLAGQDITAFYDCFTERYHMLGHDDPLYIVQITSDMNPGAMGQGVLLMILGDNADQCGTVTGSNVIIENPLNQPMCTGQYAVTYLRSVIPTGSEDWCDRTCISDGTQFHVVLQGSFRPLCVVTWVSLIECTEMQKETIDCELVTTGDHDPAQCYCDYEIVCEPICDDWVEYDICVKDRQIWLESAWSTEKAWEYRCKDDGTPGGQALGGSKLSDCYGAVRPIDCAGGSATCSETNNVTADLCAPT